MITNKLPKDVWNIIYFHVHQHNMVNVHKELLELTYSVKVHLDKYLETKKIHDCTNSVREVRFDDIGTFFECRCKIRPIDGREDWIIDPYHTETNN